MRWPLFRSSCPFHRSRIIVPTKSLGVNRRAQRSTAVEVHTIIDGVQGRPAPLRPPCGGQFLYGHRQYYGGGTVGGRTTQIVEMNVVGLLALGPGSRIGRCPSVASVVGPFGTCVSRAAHPPGKLRNRPICADATSASGRRCYCHEH